MRIVKLFSPPPSGRRAYARGCQFSTVAIQLAAVAAGLILCAQSVVAFPGPAGGLAPGAGVLSGVPSKSSGKYDCSGGGKIPARDEPSYSYEGVRQGIDEATKILRACPACQRFYSGIDPVKELERLKDMKAIIVTNQWVTRLEPVSNLRGGPVRIAESVTKVLPVEVGAHTFNLSRNQSPGARKHRQCIYVNPYSILVEGEAFKRLVDAGAFDEYGDGLTLAQARAIIILHELAHGAGVIPSDSLESESKTQRSYRNTRCVMDNCIPCAAHTSFCDNDEPPRPPRGRRSPGRRQPPLAPARRSSIIKKLSMAEFSMLGPMPRGSQVKPWDSRGQRKKQ